MIQLTYVAVYVQYSAHLIYFVIISLSPTNIERKQ